MTRSAAATVRWPGASIAPTSRIWAFSQVGLRNSVAKGWSTGKMASGRVSIAWPFLRSGVRPAYPVLIIYLAFVQSPGYSGRKRRILAGKLVIAAKNGLKLWRSVHLSRRSWPRRLMTRRKRFHVGVTGVVDVVPYGVLNDHHCPRLFGVQVIQLPCFAKAFRFTGVRCWVGLVVLRPGPQHPSVCGIGAGAVNHEVRLVSVPAKVALSCGTLR